MIQTTRGTLKKPIAVLAGLFLSAVSPSFAQPDQKPTLWVREVTTDLCHERPYEAGLTLFGCQPGFGIDLSPLLGDMWESMGWGSLPWQREPAARQRAPVTRFSLLAGKFMGRVDAVALGQWRLRFKIILR